MSSADELDEEELARKDGKDCYCTPSSVPETAFHSPRTGKMEDFGMEAGREMNRELLERTVLRELSVLWSGRKCCSWKEE
eukprot:1847186-Rhodomonas_salina.1